MNFHKMTTSFTRLFLSDKTEFILLDKYLLKKTMYFFYFSLGCFFF